MDWPDRIHERRRSHHGRERLVNELLDDLDEAVETIQTLTQADAIKDATIAELVAEVERLTPPPAPTPTRLIIRTSPPTQK